VSLFDYVYVDAVAGIPIHLEAILATLSICCTLWSKDSAAKTCYVGGGWGA
jgi:hypothetical protein